MKSLQEYLEIYRDIARKLNLQGDSVEMISQMLANATYISEVEHVAYSQEASLEKATLMNSKIQHCMNEMYSVYRGACPRVILRFKSISYLEWNPFDEIYTSNSFSLYYLGYYDGDFIYNSIHIPPDPDKEFVVIALLSPKMIEAEKVLEKSNTYYFDLSEGNLSSDAMVRVNGEVYNLTRIFSDHIKDGSLFDLTIPDFGMRIYAPDIFRKSVRRDITETPTSTVINVRVFKYCYLESFNSSELKQIKIKGTKPVPHIMDFLVQGGYQETSDGLILVPEISRDSLGTIHYKANRDRYLDSVLKSNSDIGSLLEEMYPEKVRTSGTSYRFESVETTKTVTLEDRRDFSWTGGYQVFDSLGSYGGLIMHGSRDYPIIIDDTLSWTPEILDSKSTYTSCLTLENPGKFDDSKIKGGVVELPISGPGRLEILTKTTQELQTKGSYDIVPSSSVITRRLTSAEDSIPLIKEILVSIVKTQNGLVSIDPAEKDLVLQIFSDGVELDYLRIGDTIKVENYDPLEKLTISLVRLSEGGSILEELDREVVPVVYVSSISEDSDGSSSDSSYTTTTEVTTDTSKEGIEKVTTVVTNQGSSASGYQFITRTGELVLSLSNDLVFLETDQTGKILSTLPIVINAALFSAGDLVTKSGSVRYEVIKSSGLECEIAADGVLTITALPGLIGSSTVIVRATYDGVTLSAPVTIKTTLSAEALQSRKLIISDDPSGKTVLAEIPVKPEGVLCSYEYLGSGKSLYLWLSGTSGIQIPGLSWITYRESIVDILDPNLTSPALNIYYIPRTPVSILTDTEISKFIETKSSYYVTHDISVRHGDQVNAKIELNVEIYQGGEPIDPKVTEVLGKYSYSFGVDLESKKSEIISGISKISQVRSIVSLGITYTDSLGIPLEWEEIKENLDKTYFVITSNINTLIR